MSPSLYIIGHRHPPAIEAKRLANLRAARCRPPPDRFMEKVIPEPNSGCWLWLGVLTGGDYGSFWYEGEKQRAHRVAWKLFRGPVPDEIYVLHSCDTHGCANPDHLFLGTHSDNMLDMLAKGRGVFQRSPEKRPRGARNGHAKLSESQAREVVALLATMVSQTEIARRFGVTTGAINHIATGRNWAHLQADLVAERVAA